VCGIIVVFVVAGLLVVTHTGSASGVETTAGTGTRDRAETAALNLPDSFTTGLSPLELSAPLVPPEEPGIPEGYLLWRTRRETWDAADADRWFIPTGEAALKDLHQANKEMIDDLLRSAP
jgi:hypothetical protein